MKLSHFLTLYKRRKSKCIKDLNVIKDLTEIIKLLEENISSKFSNIALSNIFEHISLVKENKRKNKQMRLKN